MKLEDNFCNVELSKKLLELFPQKENYVQGCFYWVKVFQEYGGDWRISGSDTFHKEVTEIVRTYTSSELGEMLPYSVITFKQYDKGFRCYEDEYKGFNDGIYGDTEADARAKMLIYLKEKGIK